MPWTPTGNIRGPQGPKGDKGDPGQGAGAVAALAADTTARTLTTLADLTGLGFPVVAGGVYRFEGRIAFRTAATTTGIRLGLTCPAFTVMAATVNIPFAADGQAAMWHGVINSSGDSVVSTGVPVANVDQLAIITGIIIPSAAGNVQIQYASEVNGSGVIVRQGSMLHYQQI